MVDIFDEVESDLRAERARRLFGRYGWLIVAAAILIVAGASGYEVWQNHMATRDREAAGHMLAAMTLADPIKPGSDPAASKAAIAAFELVAAQSPEGYRTLARLRVAALRDQSGDAAGARAAWDQVANDGDADPIFRGLANLLWVEQQVDSGDPAMLRNRLAPLLDPLNPWRNLAAEAGALIDLRTGQTAAARTALSSLAQDTAAPPDVRGRAQGLLGRLGDAPPPPAAAKVAPPPPSKPTP